MARYISRDGVFHPAKEKIGLTNHSSETIKNPSAEYSKHHGEDVLAGEPFIYEGPDRDAMFELWKSKEETLGVPFWQDPDLIARTRQLGYKTVKTYAKAMGWDPEKVKKDFEQKASVVTKHELPKAVAAVKRMGGGKDTSGQGQDKYGGFGEPADLT